MAAVMPRMWAAAGLVVITSASRSREMARASRWVSAVDGGGSGLTLNRSSFTDDLRACGPQVAFDEAWKVAAEGEVGAGWG
jgi:hypothetical protein